MFDAYAREKAFDYKHGVSHNVIEDKVSGIVEVRFFHARFDDRADAFLTLCWCVLRSNVTE